MTAQLLDGKHALVTGASRGIGTAISRSLLQHGARVTMLGRNLQSLEQAVYALESIGEVGWVVADVGDPLAVKHAFEQASTHSGRVEILVNNAGQGKSAPFLK